jgi:hypothetical protein
MSGPAWSTFGPHAIGTERFATVSSGPSFAQLAGPILEKQDRVQNPDKDEVGVVIGLAVPARPLCPRGSTRPGMAMI